MLPSLNRKSNIEERPDVVLKMEVDLSVKNHRSEKIRFEDTNWQMELMYLGPEVNLGLFVHCENYDFSKSYQAEVTLRLDFGRSRVFHIFQTEFTASESRIHVENLPKLQKLGGKNAKFNVKFSMKLKKTCVQKEIGPIFDFEKDSSYSDVVLKFPNGRKLYANRAYLSFHSKYFEVMFNSDFMEKNATEIDFFEEFEEFLDVLQIIHGVPFEIKEENVEYLMRLADKYDIKIVMEQCKETVRKMETIQLETALVLMDLYGIDGLINRLMEKFETIEELHDFKESADFSYLKDETKMAVLTKIFELSNDKQDQEEPPQRIWQKWADKLDKHILSRF